MILFLIDKSLSQSDIIECTGIRPNNFWFEYFMSLFLENCERFDDFVSLVNFIDVNNKQDVIKTLNAYDVDGNFFLYKSVLAVKKDFAKINFTKIRSRQIKAIEIENFKKE